MVFSFLLENPETGVPPLPGKGKTSSALKPEVRGRGAGYVGDSPDPWAGPSGRRAPSRRPPRLGSPSPSHVRRPAGSGRGAEPRRPPHSPRAALGSRTVSVRRLPAWGIFTRFHGSAPDRAAEAIFSGAGGPGKAALGKSSVSGSDRRGRGGSEGRGRGVRPGSGAGSRPLRTCGVGAIGLRKFLAE